MLYALKTAASLAAGRRLCERRPPKALNSRPFAIPDREPAVPQPIDPAAAREFCVRLLAAASLFEVDAEPVADALVWADRAGRPEDGLALLPSLLGKIESGVIDPRGRPLVLAEGPAVVRLDGSSGCGPVAAAEAVGLVAERVVGAGVAACFVKGGRDLGSPLHVANGIADAGSLGVCVTAVVRNEPTLRLAAVAPGDGNRSCVEWSGAELPAAVESLVAGVVGGHPLAAKPDATNPDVCEHAVFALDIEQFGAAQRFRKVAGGTVPELSDAVELSDAARAALASAASAKGVEPLT